jgi:hypothetical protein
MARASTIWLIIDHNGPLVAFTVKHELLTFLECTGLKHFLCYRLPDGGYTDNHGCSLGRIVDKKELFGGKPIRNP